MGRYNDTTYQEHVDRFDWDRGITYTFARESYIATFNVIVGTALE